MNKVTCLFRGRLCNQMFQAATVLAYGWDNGLMPIFTRKQITHVERPSYAGRNRVTREFKNLPTARWLFTKANTIVSREPCPAAYKPIPFHNGHDVIIEGWRQSEKYFKQHRSRIIESFSFRPHDLSYLKQKYAKVLGKNCVSLHFRRTDYVSAKLLHKLYEDRDYYRSALGSIEYMSGESIEQLLIFSDDPEWCRHNIQYHYNTIYVDEKRDILELALMSQCAHNVIANSTFSWWAAWLNTREDRIVVGPKRWYSDYGIGLGRSSDDLMCEEWCWV